MNKWVKFRTVRYDFQVPCLILLAVFTLTGARSMAKDRPVLDLHVMESLPVYEEPSTNSSVVSRLDRGDTVVLSPKLYGQFRKVLITFKGKPTAGYIPMKLIQRSLIQDRDAGEVDGRRLYKSGKGLGLALVASYLRQGSTSFSLSDGSSYDTTAFSSSTAFFSVFSDLAINSHWGLRGYVSFRQTSFTGVATQKDTLSPTPLSPKVTREQSLLGAGLLAKYYRSSQGYFWYGGGLELARGSKVNLKLNGIEAPTTSSDLPFFAMFFAATGVDVPAPLNLYLVPDLKVGMIPTGKPMILFFEALIGAAYLF